MTNDELSDRDLVLLRLHFSGGPLMMGACIPDSLPRHTVEETGAVCRERVAAGLMESVQTFAHGRDSLYRLTLAAVERKAERLSAVSSSPLASPEESAALAR